MAKRPSIVREFALFLKERKAWWLAPIIVLLLLLMCLIVFAPASISPFIYTVF